MQAKIGLGPTNSVVIVISPPTAVSAGNEKQSKHPLLYHVHRLTPHLLPKTGLRLKIEETISDSNMCELDLPSLE